MGDLMRNKIITNGMTIIIWIMFIFIVFYVNRISKNVNNILAECDKEWLNYTKTSCICTSDKNIEYKEPDFGRIDISGILKNNS